MDSSEYQSKVAAIIARAWSDEAFKTKLKSDPASALREMGLPLSENIRMHVVEDTATDWYFYLPPSPELAGETVGSVNIMSPGGSSSSGQCCKCIHPSAV